MTATDRADAYLTIPPGYGEALGGLRWSHRCDAVEWPDGTTLTLVTELDQLLAGTFGRPPVPPFAFVLNLYHLMKPGGPGPVPAGLDRLRRAFGRAKGAAALHRNAGRLIAELCRGLPGSAGVASLLHVSVALRARELYGQHHRPELAEEPPLERPEFERRVASRLQEFDDETLHHWLTRGCGPAPAGEQLAEEAESLPVRVARLVEVARQRPRLVGAATLTPALDAALTIPPRRRSPDALPQGGYADVTNRGDPERLLPAQFALDPDEFIRRFAELELLYYKREEPHAAEKPERVVILDQGVRTWGGVRLALAAAALALLKKDPKRVAGARLVLTSTSEPVNLTGGEVGAVADRLEASDLSPHPGATLARALQDPDDESPARDLILLTHPRSLRESLVATAADLRRPGDRVFALAVDEHGRAELAEWTTGGPVPLRSFRVDLAAAEAARVEGEAPRPRPGVEPAWTGDVEPVGFPFRPGLVAEPTDLGFDADGEWLVIAGRDGVLHGLALDGSPAAVLPRPCLNGVVLRQVDAVLGVPGGVVVCGRVRPATVESPVYPAPLGSTVTVLTSRDNTLVLPGSAAATPGASAGGDLFVAAHYDRATRRVTAHVLGPAVEGARWSAFPDLNCVAVRVPAGRPGPAGCAVDLSTRGRYPGLAGPDLVSRARLAWDRLAKGSPPFDLVPVVSQQPLPPFPGSGPYLHIQGNTILVRRAEPPWTAFEPKRDGLPLLDGRTVQRAQLAGNVLALPLGWGEERSVVLFRGPEGAVLGELPLTNRGGPFVLSQDGRLLARRRFQREVVVTETANPGPPVATTAQARLHPSMWVRVDPDPLWVTVRVGEFEHVFRFGNGRLVHALGRAPADPRVRVRDPFPGRPATDYDPVRFPPSEVVGVGRWRAVLDRLGQVLLFRDTGALVGSFLVRRERAAVWVPGGVFWGDPALIGGPVTPDAEGKIGRAVQAAAGA